MEYEEGAEMVFSDQMRKLFFSCARVCVTKLPRLRLAKDPYGYSLAIRLGVRRNNLCYI